MAELVMPRLSDTMEEGTILRWLVPDGATVSRGQELVEIETDKATMVYESDLDGVLQIVASEGDTLAVGTLIAHVGEAGSPDAEAAEAFREATTSSPAPPAEPASQIAPTAAPAGGDSSQRLGGERVKASPLARRLAGESRVDLNTLTGTGPGGRIVKADVLAAASAGPAAPGMAPPGGPGPTTAPGAASAGGPGPTTAPGAAPVSDATPAPDMTPASGGGLAGVATAKGESAEVELTRTQQTIARRMAESKATIPHFALQADVDMEECVVLRTQLKSLAAFNAPAEGTPTYNDMVVKACALALREHPRANSSYRDGRLQLHSRVNVGVAVAVDGQGAGGGALVVPTVFDADLKSLGEIARETRALSGRVREGSITPPELGGGTFTVSNLGMFGVTAFTAIINPPQAAILSVGAVAPQPVVSDWEIVSRHRMTVTLACDHRILYGADAARFIARIRELLEQPAALTL